MTPDGREPTPLGLIGAMLIAAAVGHLLGMPPLAAAGYGLLALAAVAVRRWRWPRRAARLAVAAVFATQATDVFVTPFTWPLRFAFSLVMLAVPALFVVTEADRLR